MSLSSYIHEQLAAAHRRELLEAADQSRLIAQARERRSERQRFPLPFRGPAPRPLDDRRTPRELIRDSRPPMHRPRVRANGTGKFQPIPRPSRVPAKWPQGSSRQTSKPR